MSSNELEGRVAVVTGAGQGVGQGIALALAGSGASVVVAELDASSGERSAQLIRERGGEAIAVQTDVQDAASIEACVARTLEVFGGLNILVNNAMAASVDTPVQETTDEQLQRALTVGVIATHRFMRAAYPSLRGDGRVINVRSGAEISGQRGMAAYVASKGAIAGLTRVAAKEWGADGITVNAIMPLSFGPSALQWFDENPEVAQSVMAGQAIKRGGDAETDIGSAVAFLAGPGASFITGVTINIDGGGATLS
ncbi:MAG: SDR family oxidoreductase [Candidatus Microbacterium colombiense]|nr:MAG: SDR family oxidoreductase [Microbacterium sp.]